MKHLVFKFSSDAWPLLQDASQDETLQNPKLVALKTMILEAFERDPNTYAILFTKTKLSTEVLMKWVNEDANMSRLRAVRLTGVSGVDNAGNYQGHKRFFPIECLDKLGCNAG